MAGIAAAVPVVIVVAAAVVAIVVGVVVVAITPCFFMPEAEPVRDMPAPDPVPVIHATAGGMSIMTAPGAAMATPRAVMAAPGAVIAAATLTLGVHSARRKREAAIRIERRGGQHRKRKAESEG